MRRARRASREPAPGTGQATAATAPLHHPHAAHRGATPRATRPHSTPSHTPPPPPAPPPPSLDSPRAGILGSGAILAGLALPERTGPTKRGKYIRETLLCEPIPPPPAGVIPQLPPPSDPTATMRTRLTAHRVAPSCNACHSLMD